jgi:hypothetical protein
MLLLVVLAAQSDKLVQMAQRDTLAGQLVGLVTAAALAAVVVRVKTAQMATLAAAAVVAVVAY